MFVKNLSFTLLDAELWKLNSTNSQGAVGYFIGYGIRKLDS